MIKKFVNNDKRQKSLEKLTEKFIKSVEPHSRASIIVGTTAHSMNYAIREGTDLDTMVFCQPEDIKSVLESPIFEGYNVDAKKAINYMMTDQTNLMSTRHETVDGEHNLITVHFMTPDIFVDKFANGITPQTLYSFRKVPKEYIYRFKNFEGSSMAVHVENEIIEGGFKVPMETCRIINDTYYSGSPHNKLMSKPVILFDKDGFIEPSIDRLGVDLAKRLLYEHGKDFNQKKASVMNTLVRLEKIRPDIKKCLYKEEAKRFERLVR
ncbi:MAG: hypothetical protein ACMXX9_00405 [Candidatus Woesearchaeota archaeon]